MARRLLPIGIQSFRNVRESDCYYVDKTGYALRLAEEGSRYFLSRPRRFGKSLFLDTLKELFRGSKELFKGLQVYERWDWTTRSPVVRLDFASGDFREPGYLHTNLMAQFDAIEEESGVESRYDTGPERLGRLIRTLHRRTGQRRRGGQSVCAGAGRGGLRHAQDGVGHAVGLLLVAVAGLVDGQPGLDRAGVEQVLEGLIAEGMLPGQVGVQTGSRPGNRPGGFGGTDPMAVPGSKRSFCYPAHVFAV